MMGGPVDEPGPTPPSSGKLAQGKPQKRENFPSRFSPSRDQLSWQKNQSLKNNQKVKFKTNTKQDPKN